MVEHSEIRLPEEAMRKNKNRGYQKLRVCSDAIDYYVQMSNVVRDFPFEHKRVASQNISSSDSVHRNIAEGVQ